MNKSKWVVVGLGCALGLLSFGCSSSDGGAAATPIPIEKLPQTFAETLCDAIAPCCKADDVSYSATVCKSAVTETFTDFVTENAGAKYDATAAGACLSKLKATLDSCSEVHVSTFDTTACDGVFQGTLPAGAACYSAGQCALGSYCGVDPNSAPGSFSGICIVGDPNRGPQQLHAHAKAGEACTGVCFQRDGEQLCSNDSLSETSPFCYESDGVFCLFDTGVCAPLAALGAPCENADCAIGTYCDFDHGTVCAAFHDSGPCYASAASSETGCSDKSYCSSALQQGGTGQCLSKKPDGYACRSSVECTSNKCSSAGMCGAGPAATKASCAGDFSG